MKTDIIKEIKIDSSGFLCVTPENTKFPYIYREAMDVQWDKVRKCLFSPIPREHSHGEWTYIDWFKQILAAASEQSTELRITKNTHWENIDDNLKEEILRSV